MIYDYSIKYFGYVLTDQVRKHMQRAQLFLFSITFALTAGLKVQAQTLPTESANHARSEETGAEPDANLSLYEVLGVESTATQDEIKIAHRKLAMRWHPDKNPNDPTAEKRFKQVQEAYEVLKNPMSRAAYDRGSFKKSATSPHKRAFLQMNASERTQFIENWLWDDDGEVVLSDLTTDLQASAADSKESFEALLSIFWHPHHPLSGDYLRIRMGAFEAATHSRPYRGEVLDEYLKAVRYVFKTHRSREISVNRRVSNEGGYFAGLALAAFFSSADVTPDLFRTFFDEAEAMLPRSHSVAWQSLEASLEDLNQRFPKALEKALKFYERGLYDLSRPNPENPNRPAWLYGATQNTVIDIRGIIIGLIQIAKIRPDLEAKAIRLLTRNSQLMAKGMFSELVYLSRREPIAWRALRAMIWREFNQEARTRLQKEFSAAEKALTRAATRMTPEELDRVTEIYATIRRSPAIRPSCEKWFQ